MVDEDTKRTIDAMPKEELVQEINKKIDLGSKEISMRISKRDSQA